MQARYTDTMIYKGPSMNPTLRNADLLCIVPYDKKRVRLGDVIVFVPPNSKNSVTHRVVSITSKGIRTLGDNNNEADPYFLHDENIIGRVIYAQRNNKKIKIYGGFIGRIFGYKTRALRLLKISLRKRLYLLRPIYHYFIKKGILGKIFSLQNKMKVVSFNRSEGIEMQLFLRNRVIGRRLPNRAHWYIYPPFRLFITDSYLKSLCKNNSK